MIRTFLALEIPKEALVELIKLKDANVSASYKIRWEHVDKLHLTLKFLGDTDENILDKLYFGLEEIITKNHQMDLAFVKFGIFKRDNKPKIFWAGIKENNSLDNLVNQIDVFFSNFGFEKERRKFHPHITLSRIRGFEDTNEIVRLTNLSFNEIFFTASVVTLFQSNLLPSGSVYNKLKSFYLK